MKPVVLMDVDGVINAWGVGIREAAEVGADLIEGRLSRVLVMPETKEVLQRIMRVDPEVLWLTNWRHSANSLMPGLAVIGAVPAGTVWDVITDELTWTASTDWKVYYAQAHPVVKAALAEGRPVFWFEDFGWSKFKGQRDVVKRSGIRGIDTWDRGYLALEHLAGIKELLG